MERIIIAQRPPALRGPLINIFSDYSGDSKKSAYDVISVLYVDLQASIDWELRRREVRQHYLSDGRRMSFKSLNDGQRRRALIPFLQAANSIEGLCVTLVIRKSIKHLCSDAQQFQLLQEKGDFESTWNHRSFERMLRVAHLISLLIAGLSKPLQHVYWISDEDALMANTKRSKDLKRMLEFFSGRYVKYGMGEIGFGTTAIDEGDRYEEDAAAIADLAAGAMTEIVNRVALEAGGRIRSGVAIPFDGRFSNKTELLHSWLADESQRLRRVIVLFEKADGQEYSVSTFDMG